MSKIKVRRVSDLAVQRDHEGDRPRYEYVPGVVDIHMALIAARSGQTLWGYLDLDHGNVPDDSPFAKLLK